MPFFSVVDSLAFSVAGCYVVSVGQVVCLCVTHYFWAFKGSKMQRISANYWKKDKEVDKQLQKNHFDLESHLEIGTHDVK